MDIALNLPVWQLDRKEIRIIADSDCQDERQGEISARSRLMTFCIKIKYTFFVQ